MDIKAKTLAAHIFATSNPAEIITKPGGVARNIAHNLARLGVDTTLLTVLGNDANAETIIQATKAAGVNISQIMRANAPTGIYLALLDNSGELVTAASDMANLTVLSKEQIRNKREIVKQNTSLPIVTYPLKPLKKSQAKRQRASSLSPSPWQNAKNC
jgi:pseudouridine kinase